MCAGRNKGITLGCEEGYAIDRKQENFLSDLSPQSPPHSLHNHHIQIYRTWQGLMIFISPAFVL